MALNQEIKERIFAAADELHAASPNGEFPNVEAVRQLSRAGMNNVVEAMKEWRAKQRKQVQAVREPLPAELHGVLQTAGQSLWETAQQLANESLEAARAAFEAEKTDLTELSAQQSAAFEAQTGELEAAQARIVELEAQAAAAIEQQQKQAGELAELRTQHEDSQRRATLAEQKAQETEHRAAELRAELDRAHQDADRLRQERDEAKARRDQADVRAEEAEGERDDALRQLAAGNAELAGLRAKMTAEAEQHAEQRKRAAEEVHRSAERMTKAESERDKARDAADVAREDAAKLRGELEAVKTQNAALLAALKPAAQPKRPPKA